MAVSDALEFDLPVRDGPAGPEGDETIYCDFSMLPEELGQRAGRALASMAAALRGDDSEFPWGEPDPVGVGIALQVLSFLPERTKARKRSGVPDRIPRGRAGCRRRRRSGVLAGPA